MLKSIEIDNKTLSILNKDTDILTNDPETVQLFLSRLGVSRCLEARTTKISLDECLDIHGHLFETIKSSILKKKITLAHDVVRFIIQWEEASKWQQDIATKGPFGPVIEGLRKTILILRRQMEEKDQKINEMSCQIAELSQVSMKSSISEQVCLHVVFH